jgi:DNA mismatch repair ATPase MutS
MRQYLEAKRQYRDAIVFFRMGDFYEMFYEDALVAARALDLTLTSRSKDACGVIPRCAAWARSCRKTSSATVWPEASDRRTRWPEESSSAFACGLSR